MNNTHEKAYFAGGCFWGVEYYLQNIEGVISTQVGYMGGTTKNPTHAEVVEVIFDNSKTSFQEIAKLFFEIHDPGQINRQGPDIGDQYRSEIFYTTENQKLTSQHLIDTLRQTGHQVATKLTKAPTFWPAEQYHQEYYTKTGHLPYCHTRKKKFT
ncbi:peptide-methionine (S)-S-oxide reductase [Candidatus Peregrinibacteria bacterium HGW-Peregrinibacteria-1]|jgi:peptide methionine sulfoxide reductase msrA/msrB|nr:MAG: peptide-methionine (S)-S-oxide reductase [Candidatus Peregrinibacteria bacterium HGW-Peregrinibacteria-1]